MVGYLLSIPEVKTRRSMDAKCEGSDGTTESVELEKMSKTRKSSKRQKGRSRERSGGWKAWRKNLKYKGDWFQEVQGTMMLVASVIATVTFQAGLNPPGGVWQQDTPFNSSSSSYADNGGYYRVGSALNNIGFGYNILVLPAGTAVMKYEEPEFFRQYLWANTVSFLASISVILLIVGRFPLKNRICSWLLALAMCVAVVSLGLGYFLGVQMINPMGFTNAFNTFYTLYFTVISCVGVVRVVGVWHILSFWVWLVNTLFCTFTSLLKHHCFTRTAP